MIRLENLDALAPLGERCKTGKLVAKDVYKIEDEMTYDGV